MGDHGKMRTIRGCACVCACAWVLVCVCAPPPALEAGVSRDSGVMGEAPLGDRLLSLALSLLTNSCVRKDEMRTCDVLVWCLCAFGCVCASASVRLRV